MNSTGCADFVPDLVDEGGILSSPKYEKLEEAYARGREWLKLQRGVRLVNIQSIDYKLKSTWGQSVLLLYSTSSRMRSGINSREGGKRSFEGIWKKTLRFE